MNGPQQLICSKMLIIIQRWDNAPHFKKLDNFPHHIHYPNRVVSLNKKPNYFYIIKEIEKKFNQS